MITEAGKGFIDGVVHNFIDQMVQTGLGGGTDIHTRTLANRLQAFQNLNLRAVIFTFYTWIQPFFVHNKNSFYSFLCSTTVEANWDK